MGFGRQNHPRRWHNRYWDLFGKNHPIAKMDPATWHPDQVVALQHCRSQWAKCESHATGHHTPRMGAMDLFFSMTFTVDDGCENRIGEEA
jgi:hypothetical protein